MLVNNIDISIFKAECLNKDIQSSNITIFDDWLENSLTPILLRKQETYKPVKVELFIKDKTDEDCLNNISNLVKQFGECTIKFDDLNYFYDCTILKKNHTRTNKGKYTLDVELKSGYAYKPTITEVMNRITSKTINVLGNTETPCIVEIIPIIDIIDITVEGFAEDPIVIKNLKANKIVIVDGESGTVTVDNVNKFDDTDLWEFPSLKSGPNTLKFSKNNCDINVKYKPRFI